MKRMRKKLWLWWWEGDFLPEKTFGRELIWSVNHGGPVSWPGKIRCLFWAHRDDGYGNCIYCGWWERA